MLWSVLTVPAGVVVPLRQTCKWFKLLCEFSLGRTRTSCRRSTARLASVRFPVKFTEKLTVVTSCVVSGPAG